MSKGRPFDKARLASPEMSHARQTAGCAGHAEPDVALLAGSGYGSP